MYASPTKCTQIERGVRNQKKIEKNAIEVTIRVLHLTFIAPGATHVLTVCSCQRNRLTSSPFFFVNVMHF